MPEPVRERRPRRRPDLRKLMFVLPNLFTVSSIFCGVYSIMLSAGEATGDNFYRAAVAIFFGNFFDAFDGRVARMTKTQSEFGVELDSLAGPIGNIVFSHEFYETDQRRDFVRGFMMQIVRQAGPLNTAVGGFTMSRVPWGQAHHQEFARRFGHMINIGVMGEDLPEPVNEVVLDPELCDAHGIPAPLVRYRLSDNSVRMMKYGVDRASEVLQAAGAREVLSCNPLRPSGWHLLGTCRMGDDPSTSVVDRWGRAHDVDNLFIVDGSLFVTSAAVNPTTTIQALALRTADYIKRTRGRA